MSLASLVIFLFECLAIHKLFLKYFGKSEGISIEEFIGRASLPDVLRMRWHSISAFLALCLISIGQLTGVPK